jgi:lipopolysaccharide export system permease protein
MSLIDRYLIRQIGATSLWALLALSGVIWISQALHDIDLMTTQGQSVLKFFTMTLLTLPAMAAIIAPVALLIGLIVTLNRLNAESELAVLASAGISPFRLLKPLLIAAFMGSLFTGFLTLKLMPESINLWRVMVTQIRSDFLTKIVKAGRFNELEANVIFHYRERAGDTLLGLFIQDKRDPALILVYVAERGRIVNGASGNYLVLENGSVQRETPRNRDASIVAFQRYALDLTQLVPGNGEITYSPHERLTLDLLQAYQSGRETSADMIRIETELADRFATPLYVFPFACLALAFIGRPRSARAHRLSAILYTILFAAIIRVGGFVLIVNGKELPFYLALSVAFPVICAVLVWLIDTLFGHQLARRDGLTDFIRNMISKPAEQTS